MQAADPQIDLQAIDAYLLAQVTAYRIPGLAVAIMQGNRTVFLRSYGQAGLGTSGEGQSSRPRKGRGDRSGQGERGG